MPTVTNTGAYLIHAGGARLIPTVPGMVEDKWMTHPQMQLLVDNGTIVVDAAPPADPPVDLEMETNRPSVPPRNERPVVPQPPQVRPTPPVMPSRPVQSPIATTGRPE